MLELASRQGGTYLKGALISTGAFAANFFNTSIRTSDLFQLIALHLLTPPSAVDFTLNFGGQDPKVWMRSASLG